MRQHRSRDQFGELHPTYSQGIRRLLAILIDTISVQFVVAAVLPSPWDFSDVLLSIALVVPILTALEATTGRTPGKFLLGIRVVDANGDIPTLKAAVIRNAVRIYDFGLAAYFFLPIILWDIVVRRPLPGWASGAYRFVWSETSQRWGAELAGTYVIRGPWKPVRFGSAAPSSLVQGPTRTTRRSALHANSGIRLRRRSPE